MKEELSHPSDILKKHLELNPDTVIIASYQNATGKVTVDVSAPANMPDLFFMQTLLLRKLEICLEQTILMTNKEKKE